MKTAIVTGASGGMGAAAVKKLIGAGYRVFGLDIREPESEEGLTFIKTDLTDEAAVDRAAKTVEEQCACVDAVVNMAGIYGLDSLVEIPESEFIRIFSVNLFACYRVNKAFLPLLRPGGRIVIVSSELAPLDPLPFTGLYAITKTALESYAFSLRMELQLLGHPVVVIRPGAIDTGLIGDSTRALARFCSGSKLYSCNAERFRTIVDGVETRKVPPERVAALVSRALSAKKPKLVYKLNRNPLLLILNALPDRMQCAVIKRILEK